MNGITIRDAKNDTLIDQHPGTPNEQELYKIHDNYYGKTTLKFAPYPYEVWYYSPLYHTKSSFIETVRKFNSQL